MSELASIRLAVRHDLWRQGRPGDYLLDAGQREWKAAFNATGPLASTVWNIGRQRGKTFDALVDAAETAQAIPNAILRYCAKTKDSAMGIVEPNMKALLEDCPKDMAPYLDGTTWRFPNGSTLIVFGTDAQSFAKGRGPKTHKLYLDECGFYQDLPAVEAALLPSLQTTGGRALYLSTPAESLGHPYTQRIRSAMASGNYRHDTFWSNPRVNHEAVIREEAARRGETREVFLASTYFRREYLAEVVTEESRAAFPSWNQELHKRVVDKWERPEFFDAYQSHDPGMTGDPHASLFGYFNPYDGRLYIEDELELHSAKFSVGGWAGEVKAKETHLYGVKSWNGTLLGSTDFMRAVGGMEQVPEFLRASISESAPRQPYLRVGDNPGVCRDLTLDHKLAVWPTDKHEKALEVSNANQLLFEGKVRIHSRCVRLIEQLYSTVWNKTRSAWERTDKDHGDLAGDDLPYMVRNVNWHRDPRAKHVDAAQKHILAVQQRAQGTASWEDAFRRKR